MVFQLHTTNRVALHLRHHRLQPRGVSTSRYEISDTTGFRRMVFQLHTTNRFALHLRHHRLQPRGVSTSPYDLRWISDTRLQPRGVSTSPYDPCPSRYS